MAGSAPSGGGVSTERPPRSGEAALRQPKTAWLQRVRFSVSNLLLLTTIAALLTAGWRQNEQLRRQRVEVAAAKRHVALLEEEAVNSKDRALQHAYYFRREGKYEAALAILEATTKQYRRPLAEEDWATAKAVFYMGEFNSLLRRPKEAEPYLEEYIQGALDAPDRKWVMQGSALSHLGGIRCTQGRYAEAEELLEKCLEQKVSLPGHWTYFNAQVQLGYAMMKQGKYAEAEPLLISGFEGLLARRTQLSKFTSKNRIANAAKQLVELFESWDKPERAKRWRETEALYRVED